MDLCPACGKRLPYFSVLRTCLFRQEVTIACPHCGAVVSSRTPLLGIQALWIGGGVLTIARMTSGFSGNGPGMGIAALVFWIASFWIAAPWLCRFQVAQSLAEREGTRRRTSS